MKLKFDSSHQFQLDAIASIVDLCVGKHSTKCFALSKLTIIQKNQTL